ncbi:MAG TPA: hypothetical protein PK253_10060 [Spirochaetota bacterium]|nr:hypothetical protein [Spirochaetota bacterium]HPQ53585.1 hypothetical protein [Spirochaetota bacterium]
MLIFNIVDMPPLRRCGGLNKIVYQEVPMFGLGDGWVFSAYMLCIASSILCVVYGILKWNSDGDTVKDLEQEHWVEDEIKIEKQL